VIEVIAFDGDDTLWHTESVFELTQARFREMLSPWCSPEDIDRELLAHEIANLEVFGYGIKGFTLSMIETAIELSGGRVGADTIREIIEAGKAMVAHPVELLDEVEDTIEVLRADHRLLIVTKGDLFDQESKVARSGLADLFDGVEIVSEKDEGTYRRILKEHRVEPEHFLMVGNSVRSDVLPVLSVGGHAAHVPYRVTWAHELVETPAEVAGLFHVLSSIAEVPALVRELSVRS